MPKEITHFALAGQLARALSVNSPFYGPVNKYPNLFLLGAVTPDIPFYYLAGPDRELVQNLSEPFHRRHALAPVLEFLEQDSSSPSLALPAGGRGGLPYHVGYPIPSFGLLLCRYG